VLATRPCSHAPAAALLTATLADLPCASPAPTRRPCQVLDSIQGGDNALVGVVTFDSAVHFYAVAPGQQQPAMMVMADTSDV
jgi:hypothetical protein